MTGVIIYAMRLAQANGPPTTASHSAWRTTGVWGYIGVALILLALALAPGAIVGAS